MGKHCEFCLQAYEDGYFWKHIGDQHPISCENTQNSYRQYKDDALNDEEMYTRIAYHLSYCPSCKTLEANDHLEPMDEATLKDANYCLAIACRETPAEFISGFYTSCNEILNDMNAQEEVGQEVYDELKGVIRQVNCLVARVLGRENIIVVEDASADVEEYALGARLRVEVVCSLEEREFVMGIFVMAIEFWRDGKGLIPNEGTIGVQEGEEKIIGYMGFSKFT